MKGKGTGALLAGLICLLPLGVAGMDIADFIDFDPPDTWTLKGTAYYGEDAFAVEGTITSALTTDPFNPGMSAVLFTMKFTGGSYAFNMGLNIRLGTDTVYVNHRTTSVKAFIVSVYNDTEVYLSPAPIMPRQFDIWTTYPYVADLETGSAEDAIEVESSEVLTIVNGWAVKAMKFNFFTEDESPVTLWLARDMGFAQVEMNMTLNELPLQVFLKLEGDAATWDPEEIFGMWDDTVRLGGGWRHCDWFGDIWVPAIDSPWVVHVGLGWSYCTGDEDNFFSYIDGIGWIWTQAAIYPIVYCYDKAGFLYYVEKPNSRWFWDYQTSSYIKLPPAG